MGKFFGTDGIRGIANKELTPKLAYNVGKAGAYVLSKDLNKKRPVILVGTDTRISKDLLSTALISGFCAVGADVKEVGVIPTPAIAYLTRKYNADAGVMISASHNSYEFNGIKYFNSKGFKLADEVENEIEKHLENNCENISIKLNEEIGTCTFIKNAKNDYVDFLASTVDFKNKNIKVALDCANGGTYEVAPMVMQKLGINFEIINNTPDGININKNCGSTHIEGLKQYVTENNCDIGLAFDGDGDRMLAIDNKGNFIDGDKILAICGKYFKNKGKLCKDTIVATVMSNIGLKEFGSNNKIKIAQTKVGDRYVLEEMLKEGYSIGGEQSGHVIMLDYNTTGDGILTGLQLINIILEEQKSLSDLTQIINIYPQVLVNAKVKNENKNLYKNEKEILDMIIKLEEEFKNEGRVLIRPSGTEPLVRVMLEGKDLEYISKKAKELAVLIEEKLA